MFHPKKLSKVKVFIKFIDE